MGQKNNTISLKSECVVHNDVIVKGSQRKFGKQPHLSGDDEAVNTKATECVLIGNSHTPATSPFGSRESPLVPWRSLSNNYWRKWKHGCKYSVDVSHWYRMMDGSSVHGLRFSTFAHRYIARGFNRSIIEGSSKPQWNSGTKGDGSRLKVTKIFKSYRSSCFYF